MGILRTILALAVVIYHSNILFGFRLCGGQLAVEAFYMISGFYMALVLNEKYTEKGFYKRFIYSRFYRIFPTYWVVLLLALVLSAIGIMFFKNGFYFTRYISNWNCLSCFTIFYFVIENIIIFGQDVMYFLKMNALCDPQFVTYARTFKHSANHYLLVPQAWSISIELMFYVIAPFLVKRKLFWQLLFIVASFSAKFIYANYFYLAVDPWTYRFFPFELGFFILGSVAYQFYLKIKDRSGKLVGYILLVMSLLSIVFIPEIPLAVNIKNALFYAVILCSIPFVFNALKNNSIDKYIGELSFAIYISHLLVVSVLRVFFFNHTFPMMYYGPAAMLCSTAVAVLLNKFIIIPFEKIRTKRFEGSKK